MYLKIDEISNDTPISFLTVGQFLHVISKREFKEQPEKKVIPEIFGIDILKEITSYSKAAIYSKTSKKEIPHFRRDGRLFFQKDEIFQWMTANPVKTTEEHCRILDKKLTKRGERLK